MVLRKTSFLQWLLCSILMCYFSLAWWEAFFMQNVIFWGSIQLILYNTASLTTATLSACLFQGFCHFFFFMLEWQNPPMWDNWSGAFKDTLNCQTCFLDRYMHTALHLWVLGIYFHLCFTKPSLRYCSMIYWSCRVFLSVLCVPFTGSYDGLMTDNK